MNKLKQREVLGNLYRRLATIESQLEDREGPPSEFSEWCPKFLPHYFAGPPADFHEVLFTSLDHAISQRGLKWALIAPRSGAKSTIITLAYALRCAVEGLERYTIILSDSYEQAVEHIESIKGELEDNELIAEQYPEAAGIGPTWRTNFLVLRNGCAIRAIGTGGKVRGRRRRESRPSLIILDDVENNSSITSASKRDKAWRWVTREVIPASGVGTNFISVGSALHRDCVAIRLQKLPGWEEQTCKAIHTWPTRMELWDEWENILYNLADDDRLLHARNFYLSHREAMDEGSSIYWPDRFPLYDLMLRRAEMGSPGFNTEYQGIPSNEDYTEFDPEWFDDRPNKPFWFDSMPPPNRIAYKIQGLDPSKGANDRVSDFQAHLRAVFSRDGILYCDFDLRRDKPPQMVEHSLDLYAQWGGCQQLVVEDNEGSGLLVPEFDRVARLKNLAVPLIGFTQTLNKERRIASLAPWFNRGVIRFKRNRSGLIAANQAKDFPGGDHDDAIDVLELVWGRVKSFYGLA